MRGLHVSRFEIPRDISVVGLRRHTGGGLSLPEPYDGTPASAQDGELAVQTLVERLEGVMKKCSPKSQCSPRLWSVSPQGQHESERPFVGYPTVMTLLP